MKNTKKEYIYITIKDIVKMKKLKTKIEKRIYILRKMSYKISEGFTKNGFPKK